MTDILVQLPQWLARSHNLVSRELVGQITQTTERGIRFAGHASLRASVRCLRCGQELENGISRTVGYGPDCSEAIGIPRDLTEDEIELARRDLERTTSVELWLPRSKVTVIDPTTGEHGDALIPAPEAVEPEQPSVATVENDRILLSTTFHLKEYAKSVSGARWHKPSKTWRWPASPATAAAIVRAYENYPLKTDEAFDQLLEQERQTADAQQIKSEDDLEPIPETATEPWTHQLRGYHFGMQVRTPMYAIEMGGGKSKILVDMIVNSKASSSLIVCPNSVQGVWPKQFRIHAGTEVVVFDFRGKGTIAKRLERAKQSLKVAKARGVPHVIVINYEAVWREAFGKWALGQVWDVVAYDESHRIKKPGGKWSLFAAKLGRRARMKACLTGTPLGNSPLDIYGQYRFLDPGVFGVNFNQFKRRFAVMGGYNDHEVIAYRMHPTMRDKRTGAVIDNPHYDPAIDKEFHDKLYSIAFRVGDEVLDLPGHNDTELPVELTPKGRKLYDRLTDRWIAEDEESGGVFTARNVLTRMLRQQQITGGSINDDDGNTVQVDDAKEKAFGDFLEDLPPGEPLVVFCRFIHDLNVIERMAAKHDLPYGELSGRRNDALTDDATMSPDVTVAAVQIQSGGVGIDLTRARYAMYYSLSSSLTDFDQSRKRVLRPGQERPVTFFHMVAQGTVDEKVYRALRNKREVVDYLMDENREQQEHAG